MIAILQALGLLLMLVLIALNLLVAYLDRKDNEANAVALFWTIVLLINLWLIYTAAQHGTALLLLQ